MTKRGGKLVSCAHCGKGVEDWYMVTDEVWEAAGMPWNKGQLHVACLEERLGRELVRADLLDCLLNAETLAALDAGDPNWKRKIWGLEARGLDGYS